MRNYLNMLPKDIIILICGFVSTDVDNNCNSHILITTNWYDVCDDIISLSKVNKNFEFIKKLKYIQKIRGEIGMQGDKGSCRSYIGWNDISHYYDKRHKYWLPIT